MVSIKSGPLADLDASLGGVLGLLLAGGDFEAKAGSASRALRLAPGSGAGAAAVALLGLGKAADLAKPAGEAWGASPYQVRPAAARRAVGQWGAAWQLNSCRGCSAVTCVTQAPLESHCTTALALPGCWPCAGQAGQG